MLSKSQFESIILLEYSKEKMLPRRSTSDVSPLEEWLILKLYSIRKKEEELPPRKIKGRGDDCNLNFRPAQ